jgi:adenylate kinase
MTTRTSPNIIITGTPGVGKTTHCESLAERTGLRHISVNQVVKDKECHEGWSDEFHSFMVDEDKVGRCSLKNGKINAAFIFWMTRKTQADIVTVT